MVSQHDMYRNLRAAGYSAMAAESASAAWWAASQDDALADEPYAEYDAMPTHEPMLSSLRRTDWR